jgi:hypothetical protein
MRGLARASPSNGPQAIEEAWYFVGEAGNSSHQAA